eukprot:TRINITY_DN5212_c0_g1_i1.p1 TRINITY_DN5212_c0_g1~~TRINITY_DN5212_c0_g1_i1.p1  ORF type:complete len:504 (+),score=50.73 TRINITY_DN5212_c0_g1_i1:31-1512(+)
MDNSSSKRVAEVVVVGAGISGLYCAYVLRNAGVDIVVVEASKYTGGRIRSLKGWSDWKILDLGAEFIHGKDSILNDLINENGWPHRLMFTWAQGDGEHPAELFGKEYALYYMGKEKKLLPYDTKDEEILRLNELLWNLSDLQVDENDTRTLEQYLRDCGISDRGIALADAGYSNSLCAVGSKVSLYETVMLNREWDRFGHGDYRMDDSTAVITDHLAKKLDVRLNWPVKKIDYQNRVIEISSAGGEKIYCKHVVVSVPLAILKDNSITFVPPLPSSKVTAIQALGVDNAIKVVLKFSHRFWPSRLNGIVCADSLIPEMWFEHFDRVGELTSRSKLGPEKKRPEPESYLVSAFACSRFADIATSLPEKELIVRILHQMDEMFGYNQAFKLYGSNEATEATNIVNPASKFLVDYLVQDWSKEPFIKGGYSHPAVTSNEAVRTALAAPLENKVFWAGEATHPKAYMTMHGAIETGDVAAKEVLKGLRKTPKDSAKL